MNFSFAIVHPPQLASWPTRPISHRMQSWHWNILRI
jgi:hypothetical protein